MHFEILQLYIIEGGNFVAFACPETSWNIFAPKYGVHENEFALEYCYLAIIMQLAVAFKLLQGFPSYPQAIYLSNIQSYSSFISSVQWTADKKVIENFNLISNTYAMTYENYAYSSPMLD